MKYWSDFNHKNGFNDGSSYPEGVQLYREVYCKAINKIAAQLNSQCRLVPFDKDSIHNIYFIYTVPVEWYNKFDNSQLPKKEELWDDGMTEAVDKAMELDLDDFVVVNPTISNDFNEFLKGL